MQHFKITISRVNDFRWSNNTPTIRFIRSHSMPNISAKGKSTVHLEFVKFLTLGCLVDFIGRGASATQRNAIYLHLLVRRKSMARCNCGDFKHPTSCEVSRMQNVWIFSERTQTNYAQWFALAFIFEESSLRLWCEPLSLRWTYTIRSIQSIDIVVGYRYMLACIFSILCHPTQYSHSLCRIPFAQM